MHASVQHTYCFKQRLQQEALLLQCIAIPYLVQLHIACSRHFTSNGSTGCAQQVCTGLILSTAHNNRYAALQQVVC